MVGARAQPLNTHARQERHETVKAGIRSRRSVRVLVVTNMYPSQARPALGGFVRDQVDALRAMPGLDVELFAFQPTGGWRRYARAWNELR